MYLSVNREKRNYVNKQIRLVWAPNTMSTKDYTETRSPVTIVTSKRIAQRPDGAAERCGSAHLKKIGTRSEIDMLINLYYTSNQETWESFLFIWPQMYSHLLLISNL